MVRCAHAVLALASLLALATTAQELGEGKAAIPAMRPNALTGFMAAPERSSNDEAEDVAESLIMDNTVPKDAKATKSPLSNKMLELISDGKEAAAKVMALEKEKKVLEEEAIEEATDVQKHEKILRDLQKMMAKERADERAAKAPKRPPAPVPEEKPKPEKMAKGRDKFEAAPAKFDTKKKKEKTTEDKSKNKKLKLKLKTPVTSKESVTEDAAADLKRLNKKVRDPAEKAKAENDSAKKKAKKGNKKKSGAKGKKKGGAKGKKKGGAKGKKKGGAKGKKKSGAKGKKKSGAKGKKKSGAKGKQSGQNKKPAAEKKTKEGDDFEER